MPENPGHPPGQSRTQTQNHPPSHQTDREALERDCDVEFFVAGGPGGQHRNKVETGVRLTHRPTGIVVTATERRSQSANREAAYERMAEKLDKLQRPRKPRKATKPTAASKRKRVEGKRNQSERKQARSKVKIDKE
jgi:protein subunit release factor B